jgi:hypothetical protein
MQMVIVSNLPLLVAFYPASSRAMKIPNHLPPIVSSFNSFVTPKFKPPLKLPHILHADSETLYGDKLSVGVLQLPPSTVLLPPLFPALPVTTCTAIKPPSW